MSLTLFASKDKGFNKNKYEIEDLQEKIKTETNEQSLEWGNQLANLQFETRLKKNLFLESNVFYTAFGYNNVINYTRKIDSLGSKTEDYSSKYAYNSDVFNVSSNHHLTWWLGNKVKIKL